MELRTVCDKKFSSKRAKACSHDFTVAITLGGLILLVRSIAAHGRQKDATSLSFAHAPSPTAHPRRLHAGSAPAPARTSGLTADSCIGADDH